MHDLYISWRPSASALLRFGVTRIAEADTRWVDAIAPVGEARASAGSVQYVALVLGRYSVLSDLTGSDRDRSSTFRIYSMFVAE